MLQLFLLFTFSSDTHLDNMATKKVKNCDKPGFDTRIMKDFSSFTSTFNQF